jgi:Arc/MetJ-type ribon-helix-helix transcriptional regulator
MSYPFPPDVGQLVQEHMTLGGYASEDDVLRDALLALSQRREVLTDINEGITELENGGGVPLDTVDAELRQKYGIRRNP